MQRVSVSKIEIALADVAEEMDRLEKENRELTNEVTRLSNKCERLEKLVEGYQYEEYKRSKLDIRD